MDFLRNISSSIKHPVKLQAAKYYLWHESPRSTNLDTTRGDEPFAWKPMLDDGWAHIGDERHVYKRLEEIVNNCSYMEWKHFDAGGQILMCGASSGQEMCGASNGQDMSSLYDFPLPAPPCHACSHLHCGHEIDAQVSSK
eukprot:1162017-Pelagomonas_calceolata.AAC.4